jgi:hypothetical protein
MPIFSEEAKFAAGGGRDEDSSHQLSTPEKDI